MDGEAVSIETHAEAVAKGFANHPVASTLQARDNLGDNLMPTTFPLSEAINASAGSGPRTTAVFETTEKRSLRKLDRLRASKGDS